jgi:predicted RNase H-like nuclease
LSNYVLGVDGCKGGWLACRLATATNSFVFRIYKTFAELLAAEKRAASIAVDIPIGLRNDWTPRACDKEARRLLGARASSVFPAPPRSLLRAASYPAALKQSISTFGRGLSQQTFHIFKKILEVENALRSHDSIPVFEVHPELCFRILKKEDLLHGKKTREGYEERRALLRTYCRLNLPAVDGWRSELSFRGAQVSRDDVLDAAIAAVTALKIFRGEASSIPAKPEQDQFGIGMQMLY